MHVASNIQSGLPTLGFFTDRTITTRFYEHHSNYPRVYLLFEKFSLDLLKSGHKKIGAKMIMERVRWECFTGGKDEQGYKINNDFIAHYARLFMRNHPEYRDCFETRKIKSP